MLDASPFAVELVDLSEQACDLDGREAEHDEFRQLGPSSASGVGEGGRFGAVGLDVGDVVSPAFNIGIDAFAVFLVD